MAGDELSLSPLPWIVIYTVRDDAIDIVRIPHGAQRMAVSSDEQWRLVDECVCQRAMRDGNDGIHGNGGNVVSVTYRF